MKITRIEALSAPLEREISFLYVHFKSWNPFFLFELIYLFN